MTQEDEIDLRPYVMAVVRHWRVVAGVTALFTVVAAAVSFATPVTYEATSAVAIAAPGAQPSPAAKAYLDLATGDKVVAAVAKDLAGSAGGPALSDAELKGEIKALQASDPSQITLQVRDTNAERASQIAGSWAAAFAATANSTFNNTADTVKQLETQMKVAQTQLAQAEADLAAQEARDGAAILQTQLAAQQNSLAGLYGTKSSLQAAAAQADGLRTRLRQLDPNSPGSQVDDLAILQLQLRLLSVPAQLQLPGAIAPSGRTVGAQLSYLDGLSAIIKDRTSETDRQVTAAEAAVPDLQGKLQQATDEQVPLVARRDNARQTIRDLDLKTSQAGIASQTGVNQARVVGDTAASATPLSRGTTKNVALALVLGLMVGIAGAFGTEYLASRREVAVPKPQPSAQQ